MTQSNPLLDALAKAEAENLSIQQLITSLEEAPPPLTNIRAWTVYRLHPNWNMPTIIFVAIRFSKSQRLRLEAVEELASRLELVGQPSLYLAKVEKLASEIEDEAVKGSLQGLIESMTRHLKYERLSVYQLVSIVLTDRDQHRRQMAQQSLETAKDRDKIEINWFCKQWYATRNVGLEQVLIRQQWTTERPLDLQIFTGLKTGQLPKLAQRTPAQLKILAQAAQDGDKQIAEAALEHLKGLEGESLGRVAALWEEIHQPFLLDLLVEKQYLPRKVSEARVQVGLRLVEQWDTLANSSAVGIVEHLVNACRDENREIRQRAKTLLKKLQKPALQQELCRLVIEQDVPAATEAALEAGFLPQDNRQKALFYFVTEQWDKYEGLDFDGRILAHYYETSTPTTRRHLANKVRASGRVEYLSAITGREQRTRARQVNLEEAEVLVGVLTNHADWEQLWSLVPDLPLFWSVQAVRNLAGQDWQPTRPDQQELFNTLKELAAREVLTDQARANQLLPLAVRRAQARVPSRVNDLAFSPVQMVMAVGTGAGKVVLWNTQEGKREALIEPFGHSVAHMVYTPSGALVCAERASERDKECAIYSWQPGRQPLKLGTHAGPVTSLAAVGTDKVLSSGRDMNLSLWDTTEGRHITTRRHVYNEWARGLAVSPDNRQALHLHSKVSLMLLPSLDTAYTSVYQKLKAMGKQGIFAPNGQEFALGLFDGTLTFGRVENNHTVTLGANFSHYEQCEVQDLANRSSDGQNLLIAGWARGQVKFIDWATHEPLGQLHIPTERLTSLRVSPDGAFMAVGDSDASFTLWDLRTLDLRRLFGQPLAAGQPHLIGALAGLRENSGDWPVSLKTALDYIEAVLRYRFRYAVELSELPVIQAGDFDIEIEG